MKRLYSCFPRLLQFAAEISWSHCSPVGNINPQLLMARAIPQELQRKCAVLQNALIVARVASDVLTLVSRQPLGNDR